MKGKGETVWRIWWFGRGGRGESVIERLHKHEPISKQIGCAPARSPFIVYHARVGVGGVSQSQSGGETKNKGGKKKGETEENEEKGKTGTEKSRNRGRRGGRRHKDRRK